MADRPFLGRLIEKALTVWSPRPSVADASYSPPQPAGERSTAGLLMDGLQNLVARLGVPGDKRAASYYGFVAPMTLEQLDALYRTSWLGGRIVDTVADDMTRAWLMYSWQDSDQQEDVSKAIRAAEKRFQVPSKFNDALKWGRLYGGSVILIGIRGEDWSTPLRMETIKKKSLQFLHVVDRHRISPTGLIDTDVNSPNLGLPSYYTISEAGPLAQSVHWSRVVRFDGRRLPYNSFMRNGMWHDSELERVIDSVKDYDATKAGIASMVFEANVDIIESAGLADRLATQGGEDSIVKRFATALMLKSFNRTLLLDGGDAEGNGKEHYVQKTTQFSGVVEVISKFMVDVCGAADIPMTRLFGQSPGGLHATGDSDLDNYHAHVAAKQETHVRPQAEKIYEVLIRSEIGSIPTDFEIDFNPLTADRPKELAEVQKLRAERDKIYYDMGAITAGRIAGELKEQETYRTIEDADVEMAEELSESSADLEAQQAEMDLKLQEKKLKEKPAAPVIAPGVGPKNGVPAAATPAVAAE